MKKKKEYDEEDIKYALHLKKKSPDLSIREIAKRVNVPKSVVGRWLKDPDQSIQKAEIKEVKRGVKGYTRNRKTGAIKKDKEGKPISKRKSIDYFLKNVIKSPRGFQGKLRVKRASEDEDGNMIEDPSGEDWIVVSG